MDSRSFHLENWIALVNFISLERKMSPVKGLVNIQSTKAEGDYTKQRLKSSLRHSNATLLQFQAGILGLANLNFTMKIVPKMIWKIKQNLTAFVSMST